MSTFGRHGKYLRVDVSTGAAQAVEIPDEVSRDFIGGVGLGAWICMQEGGAVTEPLSADAPLVFAFSPLVGTPLTTSAKLAVVARSPLTGFLSDAVSSSHFAIAGKRAGFDAYVIVGKAPRLSRLVVDEGVAEMRDAGELRGRAAGECELDGFRTAAIGPAGESLVRFASITNDGRHAGRGGLGAVMGAKNLKAFSVRGSTRVDVFDAKGVVAAARDLSEKSFGPATAKYRELGTIANLLVFNRLDALPTRNFKETSFEQAPEVGAEALHEMNSHARASCAACTIGCEHVFRAPDGMPVRLEYESLFALGPLLGIGDRERVLELAALCDELGMDTISAGGTIAFAMEAGYGDLRFGDAEGVVTMLRKISAGDPLGEGSRLAAEKLGHPELAMHVKGLEIPGYDPRSMQAMALGFAVGSRGADHNRSGAYELDFSTESDRLDFRPEHASKVVDIEDRAAAMDSLILCKFLRGVFADFATEGAELLRLVTGDEVDLVEAGARVNNLKKLFNLHAGWTRADDTLPTRFLEGAEKGSLSAQKLTDMIAHYYKARCWTPNGTIPQETAAQLRLTPYLPSP